MDLRVFLRDYISEMYLRGLVGFWGCVVIEINVSFVLINIGFFGCGD